MPGLAKTQKFMLNTATIMIGAQADLHKLNPADHSIGLVKNFTMTSAPAYTELGQGVKNEIVASVMTANPCTATMETFEYTAKNIAYALGIADAISITSLATATKVNGAVDGDASPAPTAIVVDDTTGIVADNYILIKNDDDDDFIIRQVASVGSGETLNLTVALNKDVADNADVLLVNKIGIGSKDDQPYYAAKVSGKLANGEAVVILIPKIRIIKGFSLAFVTQQFGNLPMEFTVYQQVTTDPFYAEFAGDQARLFQQ